jgi:Putative auto-transporter adhesin, head GIN domain
MNNKFILPLVVVGIAAFVSSCKQRVLKGEGAKGDDVRSVAAFKAVDVEVTLKANITVQEGAQTSVKLSGYQNVIKHIKTEVKDNTLYIVFDMDDMWTIDGDDVTAEITVPSLEGLSLSGAPDAMLHGNIAGKTFDLDISGASSVGIDNINVDSFSSTISGAAKIDVRGGSVKFADYELSGAGKIKAYPLQTLETDVEISGAAKGEVSASERLVASISGAGAVRYKGHPSVTKDVSGAGEVEEDNGAK